MKQIKTHLRNFLSEGTLTQLMRIAIEFPEKKLAEDDLGEVMDINFVTGNLDEYLFTLVIFFRSPRGSSLPEGVGCRGEAPNAALRSI